MEFLKCGDKIIDQAGQSLRTLSPSLPIDDCCAVPTRQLSHDEVISVVRLANLRLITLLTRYTRLNIQHGQPLFQLGEELADGALLPAVAVLVCFRAGGVPEHGG